MKHIRVFGCMVYTRAPEGKRKKLDIKTQKLRFIGYTDTASNYKVWDEDKKRCYIHHDVIFNESDFGRPKRSVSTRPEEQKQAELELDVMTPEKSENDDGHQMQEETENGEEPDVRRSR